MGEESVAKHALPVACEDRFASELASSPQKSGVSTIYTLSPPANRGNKTGSQFPGFAQASWLQVSAAARYHRAAKAADEPMRPGARK